jgi:hypothetical protein
VRGIPFTDELGCSCFYLRYHTDPFFAFHSVNSFEDDDGSVVIDIACYKDYSVGAITYFLQAAD